jgi:hypothetical protein
MHILLAVMLLRIHLASAVGGMGMGSMMQSGSSSSPPAPTFYLTDDAGTHILTNDAGTNRITTQ